MRLDLKSLFVGIIIGSVGLATVFGAAPAYRVQPAEDIQIQWMDEKIAYKAPIMTVINDETGESLLYLPLREEYERLGGMVHWLPEKNMVGILDESLMDPAFGRGFLLSEKLLSEIKPVVSINGVEAESFYVETNRSKNNYHNMYLTDSFQEFFIEGKAYPVTKLTDEIKIKFQIKPDSVHVRAVPLDETGQVTLRSSHPHINYLNQASYETSFNLEKSEVESGLYDTDKVYGGLHISYKLYGEDFDIAVIVAIDK